MTAQRAAGKSEAAAPTRAVPLPPAERGATVIPEKVVARIAARAAKEALAESTDTSAAPAQLAAPKPRRPSPAAQPGWGSPWSCPIRQTSPWPPAAYSTTSASG